MSLLRGDRCRSDRRARRSSLHARVRGPGIRPTAQPSALTHTPIGNCRPGLRAARSTQATTARSTRATTATSAQATTA